MVNSVPDVSVVVPLFRTEVFVEEMARRVDESLGNQGLEFELIFVDDRSPGRDLEIARESARSDSRIIVVALDRNVGQNQALIAGMHRSNGRWTVLIDGDLQDPPEAIPRLIEEGGMGFDAVFGGRIGRYENWTRLLTSRVFKRIQSVLCGVSADAGLFVALSRRMVDTVLAHADSRSRIIPLIGWSGLPMISVPVERSKRSSGSSAYRGVDRLRSGIETLAFAVVRKSSGQVGRHRHPER